MTRLIVSVFRGPRGCYTEDALRGWQLLCSNSSQPFTAADMALPFEEWGSQCFPDSGWIPLMPSLHAGDNLVILEYAVSHPDGTFVDRDGRSTGLRIVAKIVDDAEQVKWQSSVVLDRAMMPALTRKNAPLNRVSTPDAVSISNRSPSDSQDDWPFHLFYRSTLTFFKESFMTGLGSHYGARHEYRTRLSTERRSKEDWSQLVVAIDAEHAHAVVQKLLPPH